MQSGTSVIRLMSACVLITMEPGVLFPLISRSWYYPSKALSRSTCCGFFHRINAVRMDIHNA
jgi:hypothetical protein